MKARGKAARLAVSLSRIRESRRAKEKDGGNGKSLQGSGRGGSGRRASLSLNYQLPGWVSLGQWCFRRSLLIPLPQSLRFFAQDLRQKEGQGELKESIKEFIKDPLLFKKEDFPHNLIFYDLETTGLSSGAGTRVFLAGFLSISSSENMLQLVQLFMADYPGETRFLQEVKAICGEEKCYVSYNGKGFDRHLLLSRFMVNRIPLSIPKQLDLLHVSRSLWKRILPDCTLSRIEKEILGVEREEDIPGRDIPERYFAWLKDGNPEHLEAVFAHHQQDLISLFLLLDWIESMAEEPEKANGDELAGLGHLFQKRGRKGEQELFLQAWRLGSLQAGHRAILGLKREERYRDALTLAEEIWRNSASLFSGLEAAKLLEHREKRYDKALELVKAMLEHEKADRIRQALIHRQERLERRLYNSS
jgi:uncharacterized protein